MPISDAEALAWAEEREGRATGAAHETADDGATGPLSVTQAEGAEILNAAVPGGTSTPFAGAGAMSAVARPVRRELTIVLTLLPGPDDATLRACYSVGAAGSPYPVMSTLVVADPSRAAAQIPDKIAEAEARWQAHPALAGAAPGTTIARQGPATSAAPTTGKARAGDRGKGQGKRTRGDDVARLEAALRGDTVATERSTATAPATPSDAAVPTAAVQEPTSAATSQPDAPLALKTTARGEQLSLFG